MTQCVCLIHPQDLMKDLKSELSKNLERLIIGLMLTPAEFDAKMMSKAMEVQLFFGCFGASRIMVGMVDLVTAATKYYYHGRFRELFSLFFSCLALKCQRKFKKSQLLFLKDQDVIIRSLVSIPKPNTFSLLSERSKEPRKNWHLSQFLLHPPT